MENLRAIPGRGAIPDSSGTRGRRWIIITGLVPYKKQLAEYHAKFDGAAFNDPREDVPKYAGYFVQRAEVIPGSEPKWSKFMGFPPSSADRMVGQPLEEVADPRFVNPALTANLPTLVDATWGPEAVLPPQIPFVGRAKPAGDAAGALGRDQIARGGDANPIAAAPMGNPGYASAAGLGGGLLGTDAAKPATENANPQTEAAQVPDYYLLRFLDFDVKPNKQYQYRVFLVLRNPNFQLETSVLEEPELRDSELLGVQTPKPTTDAKGDIVDWPTNPKYAKWSAPCTAGRVPGDLRLLGGPVTAAKSLKESQRRGSRPALAGAVRTQRQLLQRWLGPWHNPQLPWNIDQDARRHENPIRSYHQLHSRRSPRGRIAARRQGRQPEGSRLGPRDGRIGQPSDARRGGRGQGMGRGQETVGKTRGATGCPAAGRETHRSAQT